ncbi:MAG TPA: asparaginase [Micromonosporaceae bacterium]|nr:asparaginase [Micromonosporaceae bacterium]
MSELLAEVLRSGFVESRHHGEVAVLGPDGALVAAAGDITAPMFPRSANKPLQAVGMLRAGLPLTGVELALVTASHRGEPAHLAVVRRMLGSAGLDEDVLACPPAYPLAEPARHAALRAGMPPSRTFANCSGKHAGMVLTCLANGWPVRGYLAVDHPVQVAITDAVADLAGEAVSALGVDGCGAPVHAISLYGLARAFRRLVDAVPGTAEHAVAAAMRAHPAMVSGTDPGAWDTRLMTAVPGLVSKGGAEGVSAVAVPRVGAVAVKISDGAMRAVPAVLASALRRLGVAVPDLGEPILGGGVPVGVVRALW